MSKDQFRKLQKQIGIILNKFEKDAVERTVDITSDEFRFVYDALQEELLKRVGLTQEQYNELKKQHKTPKKPIDYK
jgi:uncharacterized protein YjgD (DUF1641 family)